MVYKVFMPAAEGEDKPKLLMNMSENMESFLYGMGRIFPAVIVLNLAWAVGDVMTVVGADRLFARWISGGIDPETLPTLSFLISFFMALATGTSWGTMTILFPMVLVPTFNASGGDATIFYATTAGILSGSIAKLVGARGEFRHGRGGSIPTNPRATLPS
jgi:Na+/H+ antiporter NhaC